MEKEAGEMDPDYMFFLNHLRPHGTSYLLQVNSPDHRHPIRITYEEEEEEEEAEEEEEEEEAEEEERGEEDGHVGSAVGEADALWRNFLRHLRRKRDGSLVLELESGVVLQYGEPEQQGQEQEDEGSANENRGPKHVKQASCSSSSTPRGNRRDHVLLSSNRNRCAPPPQKPTRRSSERGTKDSDFAKELMKELERPFNGAEYDKLMKLANASKPVVKFKHLRGDDIPYESQTMGNSYFDYYPDLARKVKHADHCEGLNLLRGLFFWLKNIEVEGSYRPWAPKSSHLRTIPSCSYELLA